MAKTSKAVHHPKAQVVPGAAPEIGAHQAKPKGHQAKKTGIAQTFSSDTVDALKSPALGIRRAQSAKLSGPEIADATVLSEFPLADLSQVKTVGRWAQGFRLDGGSLRLMWMNVRRTQEKDGTSGFEVAFQAQGPSVENFKLRLAKAGATKGQYKFANSEVDTGAVDKAVLKKTGEEWGPSGQETLSLQEPGKWSVDYVTASPEALKGSFRIRLFGSDADATAALSDVIKKLGMQALFSPPSPNALERFKLLRFIWQVAPGAADHLKYKPLSMLAEGLKEPVELAELNPESEKAIAELKLDTPEIKERAQLAELLYHKSPAAFLQWNLTQADHHGMIPSDGLSAPGLKSALSAAGIAANSPELAAALAKTPALDTVRPLFLLSLLAKSSPGAAQAAITRDASTIKLSEIHAALTAAGLDPQGDRVKNLRYEEVYPGYFTVIDPSLSPELEKAGARYLYSTSDNPERVWQMLTGGQKSSMTRFQEGVLIQGKSSDSDFGTGGAFSVFSRLVTDSVIQKAKTEQGEGDYWSGTKFEDWSGSRPFKLILNRRLLERTDWYAYNEDNFGNSKEATAANHGKKIVETINAEYSSSNEVMFPVGNDPSFVDFVVAPDEAQKKALVDFLISKDILEFNGKKVEDFVIVRTKFFEHPDDLTLANAVADAVRQHGFQPILQAALEPVKEAATQSLDEKLGPIVDQLMAAEAPQQIKTSADYYCITSINEAAGAALAAKPDALAAFGLEAVTQAAAVAAGEAVAARAKQYLVSSNYYPVYQIHTAIRQEIEGKLPPEAAEEAFAKALKQFIATQPPPTSAEPEARLDLELALNDLIQTELRAVAQKLVDTEGADFGKAHIEQLVTVEVPNKIKNSARNWASSALPKAAIGAVPAEALASLLAELEPAAAVTAEVKVREQIKNSAATWLQYAVKDKVVTEAKAFLSSSLVAAATGPALEAAKEPLAELVKKTTADFGAASPEKVNAAEEAKIPGAVQNAFEVLLRAAGTTATDALAEERSTKRLGAALEELAKGPLYEELGKEIVAAKLHTATQFSVETALGNAIVAAQPDLAESIATAGLAKTAESVKGQVLDMLLPGALERTARTIANQLWSDLSDKAETDEKKNAAIDEIMKKVAVAAEGVAAAEGVVAAEGVAAPEVAGPEGVAAPEVAGPEGVAAPEVAAPEVATAAEAPKAEAPPS